MLPMNLQINLITLPINWFKFGEKKTSSTIVAAVMQQFQHFMPSNTLVHLNKTPK